MMGPRILTRVEAIEIAVDKVITWAQAQARLAPTTEDAGTYGAVELVARNARARIKMRLAEAEAHREIHAECVINGITNELWDLWLTLKRRGLPVADVLHDTIYEGRRAGVLS